MKISPAFAELKKAIDGMDVNKAFIHKSGKPQTIQSLQKQYLDAGLSEKRFRWDLFHASKFGSKKLYDEGLDDSHIDSALKAIISSRLKTQAEWKNKKYAITKKSVFHTMLGSMGFRPGDVPYADSSRGTPKTFVNQSTTPYRTFKAAARQQGYNETSSKPMNRNGDIVHTYEHKNGQSMHVLSRTNEAKPSQRDVYGLTHYTPRKEESTVTVEAKLSSLMTKAPTAVEAKLSSLKTEAASREKTQRDIYMQAAAHAKNDRHFHKLVADAFHKRGNQYDKMRDNATKEDKIKDYGMLAKGHHSMGEFHRGAAMKSSDKPYVDKTSVKPNDEGKTPGSPVHVKKGPSVENSLKHHLKNNWAIQHGSPEHKMLQTPRGKEILKADRAEKKQQVELKKSKTPKVKYDKYHPKWNSGRMIKSAPKKAVVKKPIKKITTKVGKTSGMKPAFKNAKR
jgi:hypothetical protein